MTHASLMVALAATMSGCAGESSGPDDIDEGGSSGPLTDERRIATLREVINRIPALTGSDANARRQEMLAVLRGRPEFEEVGEDEDGSLWARFTDGRLFVIIANRDALTQAEVDSIVADLDLTSAPASPAGLAAASLPGPPNGLPKSENARFYLGGEPPGYPTVIPWLQQIVKSRGYVITPGAGIGTIDDLKNVSGDGIFYWTSHGGPGRRRDGSRGYGIASATQISVLNDIRYKQDWDSLRLVYTTRVTRNFLPSWGVNDSLPAYYAITAEFVRRYMSFEKDSFIYLGACSAMSPANIELAQAFADKGGVVAGWTSSFSSGKDAQTAMYVFDRLLGANLYRPESPRQRPFDYVSIKANMAPYDEESIGTAAGIPVISEFTFLPGSNGISGLLAPSIQHMFMNEETGRLVLAGKFGSEMGRAEVDGVARPVRRWSEDTVEIDIPVTGNGSAGNVVVYSRNRRSNARPLTDWRGDFFWTFAPGQGSLRFDGVIRVHFRADVHTFREEHRQQPKHRLVSFRCAPDTNGQVTASGNDGTTSWRGTATMSNRLSTSTGPNAIDCMGEIDTELKQLRLFLFATAQNGLTIVSDGVSVPFPVVWAYGDGPLLGPNPLPSLYIPLSQDWAITADHRMAAPSPPSQRLDWPAIIPTHIPADSTAR